MILSLDVKNYKRFRVEFRSISVEESKQSYASSIL